MAPDNLGIFDTPPTRQEKRWGLTFVGLFFVALIPILLVPDFRMAEINAFVPVVDAVMFVGELIIATLLYAQAVVFRSRALTVLASGFVFSALLLIPHALTFPGAFAENGLLEAGVNTTAWIALIRRLGLCCAVLLYAWLKSTKPAALPDAERRSAMVFEGLSLAIVLATLVTLHATVGQDWLPSLFINRADLVYSNITLFNGLTIAIIAGAMALLFLNRGSVLDMWLIVAMSGSLLQTILNMKVSARFTLDWYSLFFMMIMSNLIIMLALLTESNRLYAKMAISTAARARERDTRLMSMDAVAAAIAHEVAQPLSAVTMNATAGLNWLDREPPEPARARELMRATLEAGQRSFEVIKSIRAMFSTTSGSLNEFSLNELVRETTALLDREMAAQKVSLSLDLDETLPTISANRVQIQRVLINLLTNAIESLSATQRRARRIIIRTASSHPDGVLLEVTDSGLGIAPDKIAHIFDPFVTTKATGTGLGLSLSKTIVEDHGGRLWATQSEKNGATFHLQMQAAGGAR